MKIFYKTFTLDISDNTTVLDKVLNICKTKWLTCVINPFVDEELVYDINLKTSMPKYTDSILIKILKKDQSGNDTELSENEIIFLNWLDEYLEYEEDSSSLEEEESDLAKKIQKISNWEKVRNFETILGWALIILASLLLISIVTFWNITWTEKTVIEFFLETIKSPWDEFLLRKAIYLFFIVLWCIWFVVSYPQLYTHEDLKRLQEELKIIQEKKEIARVFEL